MAFAKHAPSALHIHPHDWWGWGGGEADVVQGEVFHFRIEIGAETDRTSRACPFSAFSPRPALALGSTFPGYFTKTTRRERVLPGVSIRKK